jgi:hypothetical protein
MLPHPFAPGLRRTALLFRALCAFASAGPIVSARQEPGAAGLDEVANLPTFTITEKPVSECQSHQALSTTRVTHAFVNES